MDKYVSAKRLKCLSYLGEKCVTCGSSYDLQFDHIDPSSKTFTIGRNYNRSWESLVEELNKCQLLCVECHKQKTNDNKEHVGGHNKWKEIQHGTVHAYLAYKCRCDECKLAKREYAKKLRLISSEE